MNDTLKQIKAGKLHVLWFQALDRIIFKQMCSQHGWLIISRAQEGNCE